MKQTLKRLTALILALTMVLSLSITAFAAEAAPETDGNAVPPAASEEDDTVWYSGKAGDNATYTLYTNGDLVFSGTGSIGYIWSEGLPYEALDSIKDITIEEGITEVLSHCFAATIDEWYWYFCRSIAVPSTLKKAGVGAFKNITFDTLYIADMDAWCRCDFESYRANPATRAQSVVYQGKEVTHVDVPAGVTSLNLTFAGFKQLETVTIPSSVKSLSGTFYGSGLREITLPSSVESIGNFWAYDDGDEDTAPFGFCEQLVYADLSASKTPYVPSFYGCSNLKTVLPPKNALTIVWRAFAGCSSLETFTAPHSLTMFDNGWIFDGCTNLKSLYLPGVAYIDTMNIRNCPSLKTLVLGSIVEASYSNSARFFEGCNSSLTVYADKRFFDGFTFKTHASTITASNFTKTSSTSAQTFNLGVKTLDNAKLTYSTASQKVTIDKSGNVTIPAKYVGKLTIKIKAAATSKFPARTKSITLTVNPSKTTLSSVSNIRTRKVKVKWNRNTIGSGYQVQCSTDKTFTKGVSSKTISGNSIVSTTFSQRTKGKTYYVRIRTYKTVSGVKYYSGWSALKSVKIVR